jgi:hypothetical protein
MNTAEIECILRRALLPLNVKCSGVFAADTIPNDLEFPACFVVNTDPASKPGEHWVACYANSPDDVEFFDSYGLSVSAYPHIRLPHKITKYNDVSLQHINSYACGHFCIYYICRRALKFPLSRIVKHLLSFHSEQRDNLVRRYVFKLTSSLRIARPCVDSCIGLQCCGKRILK